MEPLLPWANPVFVEMQTGDSNINDSTDNSIDRWVFRSERRLNVQAFAYLLLSEFAGGRIITKCVSESLLSRIFDDSRFSVILREFRAQKSQNLSQNSESYKALHQQIDHLLRDAFAHVDADSHESVTAIETNSDNLWDDSAIALTGGCSAVLALILDDHLYVANCGQSMILLGQKIGDKMTVFPLSHTMETCGYGIMSGAASAVSHEPAAIFPPDQRLHAFIEFTYCRPRSCFSDYSRKPDTTGANIASTVEAPPKKKWVSAVDATAVPLILQQHIELNESTKFLLLISPQTAKIIHFLNSGNDASPNAIFASRLLERLNSSDEEDIFGIVRDLLNDLLSRFIVESGSALMGYPKCRLSLAMAYINLKYNTYQIDSNKVSDGVQMMVNSETSHLLAPTSGSEQPRTVSTVRLLNVAEFARPFNTPPNKSIERRHESTPNHIDNEASDDDLVPNNDARPTELEPVPSVVDWSEFYTHELHRHCVGEG